MCFPRNIFVSYLADDFSSAVRPRCTGRRTCPVGVVCLRVFCDWVTMDVLCSGATHCTRQAVTRVNIGCRCDTNQTRLTPHAAQLVQVCFRKCEKCWIGWTQHLHTGEGVRTPGARHIISSQHTQVFFYKISHLIKGISLYRNDVIQFFPASLPLSRHRAVSVDSTSDAPSSALAPSPSDSPREPSLSPWQPSLCGVTSTQAPGPRKHMSMAGPRGGSRGRSKGKSKGRPTMTQVDRKEDP